jgi:hypothetical protein
MKSKPRGYSEFVEHPRFGRGPRYTNVSPRDKPLGYRLRNYNSDDLIDGTAVEADLEKQPPSPIPVLYYFDLKRVCVDCNRPFIFFAEEQKFWYESLGFSLGADCIRCINCRKQQQGNEQRRHRYEELLHKQQRSIEEDFQMAECCIELIESGLFHNRQTERIRMLLNRIARNGDVDQRYIGLRNRVVAIEVARGGEQSDEPEPS